MAATEALADAGTLGVLVHHTGFLALYCLAAEHPTGHEHGK